MPKTLLERIAGGDKPAVQECLTRYGGLVWSLARRFLGNSTEAEDAVQEIFVELWKNAERFNPALSSEPTYITMISRRRLIDRRRRMGRRPEPVPLPEVGVPGTSTTTESVEVMDEAARALTALAELRPEQQQVLKMAVYQGMTHEEIARDIGLPLGTVKTHARRGLIRLRKLLETNAPSLSGVSLTPSLKGGL